MPHPAPDPELLSRMATEPGSRHLQPPGQQPGDATGHTEREILWQSSEGQVANLWVFVLAVLLFWLLLPVGYALYRYLATARHRYTLTDQRLIEESGIVVRQLETVELYRVKDLSVSGTLAQSLFGRGRVIVQSTDSTCPTLTLNAVANPKAVASRLREAVERCRTQRGVRAFDF